MSFFRRHWSVGLAILACLVIAQPVRAVPPPDFIINVGSQMAQFFSLALLFLTAIFSSVNQFLQIRFGSARVKRGYWIGGLLLIVVVSGIGAKIFGVILEQRALAKLALTPEKKIEEVLPEQPIGQGSKDLDRALVPTSTITPEVPVRLSADQLAGTVSVTTNVTEDAVAKFIRRYYAAIGSRDFRTAYSLSKKAVSYEVFASWYATTKSVTINTLRRIDRTHSSLELVLEEEGVRSRYAVSLDVELDKNEIPVRVASSSVRLVGTEQISSSGVGTVAAPVETATTVALPFKLSNDRLKTLLQHPTIPFLVLDARENIEHEYGSFPQSVHIRYADLKAGRWAELPTDRAIIVLCWSGIRGSQVASFLHEKQLAASYLENGANGWVASGGVWEGSVLFADRFPEERYKLAFSKDEMTRRVQGGALLIDAREPADRAKHAFANAIPISLLATPSAELEALLQSVPAEKSVITVCSAYVDCFEAKLVGVELERKGHPFLGRYVYTP